MELIKVSDYCYYTPHSDYGDRPALGYITNNGYSVLIDAGASEAHLNELLHLLDEKNLPRPYACYITHSHWDHTFGLSALPDDIKIIATSRASHMMEKNNNELLNLAKEFAKKSFRTGEDFQSIVNKNVSLESTKFMLTKMNEEYGLDFSNIKLVYPNFRIANYDYMFEGYKLTPISMVAMKSPHCKDSAIYYSMKEKVLFVGDALYSDFDKESYTEMDKRNVVIPFYRKLEKLSFDIVIPSHSKPLTKDEALNYLKIEYDLF